MITDHISDAKYLFDNGILHCKVTPLWAQANGQVERQNWRLHKLKVKVGGKSSLTASQPIEQRRTVLPESAPRSHCLVEE